MNFPQCPNGVLVDFMDGPDAKPHCLGRPTLKTADRQPAILIAIMEIDSLGVKEWFPEPE